MEGDLVMERTGIVDVSEVQAIDFSVGMENYFPEAAKFLRDNPDWEDLLNSHETENPVETNHVLSPEEAAQAQLLALSEKVHSSMIDGRSSVFTDSVDETVLDHLINQLTKKGWYARRNLWITDATSCAGFPILEWSRTPFINPIASESCRPKRKGFLGWFLQ